jgi:ArsR family transcriptional regulator, lead/cadmium/zinc/bismuth-responsive transcriptional repressor
LGFGRLKAHGLKWLVGSDEGRAGGPRGPGVSGAWSLEPEAWSLKRLEPEVEPHPCYTQHMNTGSYVHLFGEGRQAAAEAGLLDAESAAALAETFRMLGDITRVRILDALSRSELCVQDIARRLDLTESAVSHQLRLLRGMRLVRPRRAGKQIFYTLDDQHIVRLFAQGLEHVLESGRPPRVQTNAPSGSGSEQ